MFADPIVRCSVELYLKTIEDFLPTPAKCQYTFNLRDLSKVIQGMLMSNLSDLDTKPTLVSLWIHETFRVFRDRLVDANDREKYSILAHDKLEAYLSMDWKLKEFENLLFGDYESSNRSYVRLSEVN